jgi:WD40 repeat protein
MRLWEVGGGKQLRKSESAEAMYRGVTLSGGGELAAFVTDDGVDLWDTTKPKKLWECKVKGGRQNFALSADGKRLATVEGEPTYSETVRLQVWDTSTHGRLQEWKTDNLSSIAFSADGKLLAARTHFARIDLFDVAAGTKLRSWQTKPKSIDAMPIGEITFSPDGKTLASPHGDQTIRLWETATGQYRDWVAKYPAGIDNLYVICAITFSPDGKLLASAGYENTVHLWDTVTAKEVARLTGHEGEVLSVAFSPDGKLLASGSGDTTILIWDVQGALMSKGKSAATRPR